MISLSMLFSVCFMAAITPGPDVLIVVRNCLRFGFLSALKILAGIATGWIIIFALIGLGLAKFASFVLFQCIVGAIGGLYLIYSAYKLIRSKAPDIDIGGAGAPDTYLKALMVNLSNPKAILFFVIILSPFIERDLGPATLVSFCALSSAFLFVIAMCCLFRKFASPGIFLLIDRICGVLFFIFGALLLARSAKLLGFFDGF